MAEDYWVKTTRSMLATAKEVGGMAFCIYQYYLTFIENGQNIPSLETTAIAFGISKSAVSNHNKQLLLKGWIRRSGENFICTKDKDFEPYIEPETYLYLMKDTSTGYTKIGISNKPGYREKTLQGEKPTIELLAAWKATRKDEKDLHVVYRSVRIRGEWFDLSDEDIKTIYWLMQEKEAYCAENEN